MKTGAAVLGMVVTGAIGFAIGLSMKSSQNAGTVTVREGEKTSEAGKQPPPSGAQPQTDVFKVPVGGAAVKGPEDALVTIVEFSDFECPFCSRVVPTLDQIKQEYGDKVRIAFRHNPLPFHPNAAPASEWALAANEQGKFWEMHNKLFENRAALQKENLEKYATEVGVDVAKAKAYIESGKPKEIIRQDQALAEKVGARGTPSFFINGVSLTGAQPFQNFKALIDAQLEKAEKLVQGGTPKAKLYETIIAQGRESAPPPQQQQQQQQQPPATRQKVALVEGTPTKGGKQALVTIVEWSDFECPFCGRAMPTVEQILKTYGDKVQLQFRHQPLSFHPRAMPSAKATAAAHLQGKFWEMHDKLFANQRALQDADIEKYAQESGLNIKKWKADMESPQVQSQIQRDMTDGNTYGARGTPSFFVNGIPVRGALPFEHFKSIIDKEIELAEKLLKEGVKRGDLYNEILAREGGKAVAGAEPAPQRPAAPAGPVDIKLGRAPVRGDKNAPIQVVLWSDFECPFCGRVNPTIEKLRETYGNKVSVAFKHYPLPFHPHAELAAVASLAAHKQGKFWEMHDKLFANNRALEKDNLVGYAKELGLNVGQFEKDLNDPELKSWVQADMAEGTKNGVNGTPATFINGRLVSGAQPYEAFQSIVDEELKKRS
jgi:protein-disulfide isomerase